MGDFSGGLGNSLGDKSTLKPNQRFNCLFNEICSAEALDLCAESTYDHLPIMVKLNQS